MLIDLIQRLRIKERKQAAETKAQEKHLRLVLRVADPAKPATRAPGAFNLFVGSTVRKLRAEQPKADITELMKTVAGQWKSLSDSEKQVFSLPRKLSASELEPIASHSSMRLAS